MSMLRMGSFMGSGAGLPAGPGAEGPGGVGSPIGLLFLLTQAS
jgi:hypothetical protein